MLAVLKDSPVDVFAPGSLEKGIASHRWGKFVIPDGMTTGNMPRGADGRLLGEVPGDGNVFDHQLAQERLIARYGILDVGSDAILHSGYAKLRSISLSDFFKLRITALVHDLGEIEHGDVVFDDKHLAAHTTEDEVAATRKFVRKALDERTSRKNAEGGREDPRRRRRLERGIMAAYAIDHNQSHRLHGVFKLYEKYSYISGAIAIYGNGIGTIAKSHAAVHNVFKNQISALVTAAQSGIPSAAAFLSERAETITAMFAWLCASGFHDGIEENQERLEEAKRVWTGFVSDTELCRIGKGRVKNFDEVARIAEERSRHPGRQTAEIG